MPYFLVFMMLLLSFSVAQASTKPNRNMDICRDATRAAEQDFGIPRNLLRAISLTESGRWIPSDKENIAWPWTVASGKAGEFFPTKSAAIKHVRKLQAEGVTNIDVGCMQINLRYHPDAFKNLNEAFDPYKNTQYAGKFLSNLFKRTKSWTQAASHYHNSDPTRGMFYREKVLAYWNHANQNSHAEDQKKSRERKPAYRVAAIDQDRTALLNNNFRQRLQAQRKAMSRAEKMSNQISQWRNNQRLTNFGQVAAAKQRALHNQKRKKSLMLPNTSRRGLQKHDFSQRRAAQLDKWRRTVANPELFKN